MQSIQGSEGLLYPGTNRRCDIAPYRPAGGPDSRGFPTAGKEAMTQKPQNSSGRYRSGSGWGMQGPALRCSSTDDGQAEHTAQPLAARACWRMQPLGIARFSGKDAAGDLSRAPVKLSCTEASPIVEP